MHQVSSVWVLCTLRKCCMVLDKLKSGIPEATKLRACDLARDIDACNLLTVLERLGIAGTLLHSHMMITKLCLHAVVLRWVLLNISAVRPAEACLVGSLRRHSIRRIPTLRCGMHRKAGIKTLLGIKDTVHVLCLLRTLRKSGVKQCSKGVTGLAKVTNFSSIS